jgi:hypothetical protein
MMGIGYFKLKQRQIVRGDVREKGVKKALVTKTSSAPTKNTMGDPRCPNVEKGLATSFSRVSARTFFKWETKKF